MSWTTLSKSHVLARLSSDEKEALELVGEQASVNKLAAICEQVTSLVRSKVATCPANTLGTAGTIPADSLFHAVTIARAALIAAQPTREGVTDPRAAELVAAHKYLDAVAECKVAISDESGNYPSAAAESSPTYGGAELLDF